MRKDFGIDRFAMLAGEKKYVRGKVPSKKEKRLMLQRFDDGATHLISSAQYDAWAMDTGHKPGKKYDEDGNPKKVVDPIKKREGESQEQYIARMIAMFSE